LLTLSSPLPPSKGGRLNPLTNFNFLTRFN
jgi:hypothetical protein